MLCGWEVKAGMARVWLQVVATKRYTNPRFLSYLLAMLGRVERMHS